MSNEIEAQAPKASQAVSIRPAADVLAHIKAIQKIMASVMKVGVHYGAIPGAGDKPVLLKPGAELLCMTFRIADGYEVTDLSAPGVIRYRIKCVGSHQDTEVVLGSGLGECSTDEEKYRWRRAVCQEEFDAVPENMRRIKYGRKQNGHYTVQQVKTEQADLANTVLKMACKRAKIAMVLNVTAASDMFSQDLEDLDAELVRHLAESDRESHMQDAQKEWCDKAAQADTEADLSAVMRAGVKVFQSARDKDGYAAFAKAVQERGAQIKGVTKNV